VNSGRSPTPVLRRQQSEADDERKTAAESENRTAGREDAEVKAETWGVPLEGLWMTDCGWMTTGGAVFRLLHVQPKTTRSNEGGIAQVVGVLAHQMLSKPT
jgi:hypothetical protein